MKKLLRLIYNTLPLLVISGILWAGSTTTNLSLYKPDVNETGWGNSVNTNFDTIDTAVGTNINSDGSFQADIINDTHIDWGTAAGKVSPKDFSNEDIGDISISSGTWTLDTGVVDTTAILDDTVDSADYAAGSIDEEHLNIANSPTDEYVLSYESDTSNFEWKEMTGGGSSAWDDITNPDANDEIDFGAYTIELNVADFQIGDGGGDNYVGFDGTPTVTFNGSADIDLPNDSVDDADINWGGLTDLAAGGVLDGDCVDENHIADNGIDSEHYNDDSIDDAHLNFGTGANQISPADFSNEDIGDISIAAGSWTLDANVVDATALNVSDVSDDIAGDIAEGELTDASIVDADIKDGTIQEPALDCTNSPTDNYVLSYDSGSSGFTWVEDQTGGGGASEINILLRPQEAKLPSSNPAVIDAGNNGWRLLYDDGDTAESATWEFVLDDDYGSGTLYCDIYYTMVSGTSDEVEWQVEVMAVTDADSADVDTDSYDTENVAACTVQDTAGYMDKCTVTLSNDDNVAAGDYVRLKITTDADDATNDDATGDREFRLAVIRE
jgi:hypothetical protein